MTVTGPIPPKPTGVRRRIPVLLYAHPFEVTLGVILVVNGVRQLATGDSSPAIDDALPPVELLLYRVAGLVGGIAILAGLATRSHAAGRTIERAGLWLVAGSYAAYLVMLVAEYGVLSDATYNLLTSTAVLLGAVFRALAIRKTERVVLAQLRALNNDREALRQLIDGRPPLGSSE